MDYLTRKRPPGSLDYLKASVICGFFSGILFWVLISINTSCAPTMKWQWKASNIYRTDGGINNCTERVNKLSHAMSEAGVKHFVVVGDYMRGGEAMRHCWIVKDGEIIDPSVLDTRKFHYRELWGFMVEPGKHFTIQPSGSFSWN